MTETTTPEATFADPAETTIADLKSGDFVVLVPTQSGVRGVRFNSGVKTVTDVDMWASNWGRSNGRGRSRTPVASRKFTFNMGGSETWDFPASFTVIARTLIVSEA